MTSEIIKEQEQHYDELMKESAKYAAVRSIVEEGEKGIEAVMYEHCDNYENYTEFERAMKRIAYCTYRQYLEDTQGTEESEVEDVYREHHPDYPRC